MPFYRVYFRYVEGNKVKRESVLLDAKNMEDAKRRVIRGEKPRLVAVDRVKKQRVTTKTKPIRQKTPRITPKVGRLR